MAYKHLTFNDRLKIEAWQKVGVKPALMAEKLGVHISTIYRELKRGQYEHLNSDYTTEQRYSPDIAEEKNQANLRAKGAPLKIGSDHAYANYIEYKIRVEKYSPRAVLGEIKRQGVEFSVTISAPTLYRYIEQGVFLTITNDNLPVKRNKTERKYKKVRAARASKGDSIEKRPAEIAERTTFGHWEMDCVEGKKGTKKTMLVLTERYTRYEIIRIMKDHTAASVVKALNGIERAYGANFSKVFQTITIDNGSEFTDYEGLEKSCRRSGTRTKVYYCHPYSSYERGSNENQNKMIRRHYPKGVSFEGVTSADMRKLEKWINNYPRGIFDYYTSADLYEACINSLISA
ncbi:MAG: IS30 family transposase [Ruminococcaceae bacterium]|nr:IS30 family transposase [Oscillospiraceae bacterium]